MADRQGQWLGGAKLITVEGQADTAVGELTQMIPGTPIADVAGERTKLTIEAIYLHFSLSRLLTTTVQACSFLVWMSRMIESGNNPIQGLNALELTSRPWGNKAIMMTGPLAIPPVLAQSDLAAFVTSEEHMVSSHEFQASRKMDRASEVLTLTVNCDTSLVLQVFAQWRIWVTWG